MTRFAPFLAVLLFCAGSAAAAQVSTPVPTAPTYNSGAYGWPIQGVLGGTPVPVTVTNPTAPVSATIAWPTTPLTVTVGNVFNPGFAGSGPASPVVASPSCTKVINISQTASTDVHTFTNLGYICTIILIGTAQNIGIEEGTGTLCKTASTPLFGISPAGLPTTAINSGGFSAPSGTPWLVTQTVADHLCILQSGNGNVSGTITYLDHP